MHRSESTLKYSRIVHLSHVIAPGMPEWPGDPALHLETVADLSTHGYRLRQVAIGEHSATHVNAAATFAADGAGIDELAAERLVRSAVVIDCRAAAARDADYLLSCQDIESWERVRGRIPAGALVAVNSGWAE